MNEDIDISFFKNNEYIFLKKNKGYVTIDETDTMHYMNKRLLKEYFDWENKVEYEVNKQILKDAANLDKTPGNNLRLRAALCNIDSAKKEYCIDIYWSEDGEYIENYDYECFESLEEAVRRIELINNEGDLE